MIDLYTWTTPNGQKGSIMLEEVGLPYTVHPVDLGKGEQHRPDFVAINPNAKVPVIVDHDAPGGARSVFESGAILIYLAEKTGRLFPNDARFEVFEWLMFQMSAIGPIFSQVYTEPAHRRRGVAHALMDAMLAWCRARGITRFALHASDAGRPLYESLGFIPTNEMRRMDADPAPPSS